MIQVPPESLWLGNRGDLGAILDGTNGEICAVVDLAINEPVATLPRDVAYVRMPLIDGSGNPPKLLRAAVQLTASLLMEKIPTLVCCSAGMSRTPAIAAAAVAMLWSANPADFLDAWADDIPHDISPALWNELQTALKTAPDS